MHAIASARPQIAIRVKTETIGQTTIDGAENLATGYALAAVNNVENADMTRCFSSWL